jgi:hypothetical protein
MQTFQRPENMVMVLGCDADSVVLNFYDPVRSQPFDPETTAEYLIYISFLTLYL